jgi:hypothetical protein
MVVIAVSPLSFLYERFPKSGNDTKIMNLSVMPIYLLSILPIIFLRGEIIGILCKGTLYHYLYSHRLFVWAEDECPSSRGCGRAPFGGHISRH